MAIYFVDNYYKVDLVTLTLKCPECELNLNITAFSSQKQVKYSCQCCGHVLEIKILVCPECNSSAHVVELTTKEYYCRACEKLVSEW